MTLLARRTRWAELRCLDGVYLDLAAVLRGEARLERDAELRAFSILTGEEHELPPDELELLLALSDDEWREADGPPLAELERKGLVIVEGSVAAARDEALAACQWNLAGALYHARSRWGGVDVGLKEAGLEDLALEPEADDELVKLLGPPPPHFHTAPNACSVLELPVVEGRGGVFETLSRRRTSRRFDASHRIGAETLALVLRTVFGAQAVATLAGDAIGVRRTSPSGGGLHPIEAYPLICDVDGVPSGLHHYHCGDHALELVEPLSAQEARALASAFTCGQLYFRDASVLVVLAARFDRSFWKYRRHEKAYAVILMDAGHLSQTLYLVCAELGLGAFVTGAINNVDVDERLGLDGFDQGSLAICGFGPLVEESRDLQPEFVPYRPPR